MYFDYIQMKGFRPKNTRAKMNRQTSGCADPAESKIAALRLCGVTSNEQQKDRRPPPAGGGRATGVRAICSRANPQAQEEEGWKTLAIGNANGKSQERENLTPRRLIGKN